MNLLPISSVILSEARRSGATERESKDPYSLEFDCVTSGSSHGARENASRRLG